MTGAALLLAALCAGCGGQFQPTPYSPEHQCRVSGGFWNGHVCNYVLP
ncbi:MAG: hypothetical protein L0027_17750 [Candidatus Rokubacteria bacterium]|nr:hypothetical protein [Candidatus Rokubacteria bacterium]